MADNGWFSVRCVVRFQRDQKTLFEERVTLWRAVDFADAVRRAEAEVCEYAELLDGEYTGLAQAYKLADEPGDGAELFSLMRESDLDVGTYLDTFFDTGSEQQGEVLE
ncbi:hypothetical protein [Catellatospora sp. TT07R-123]|uniref:hypothetical protein n=1 Tax=Catellatospora sp. TT07R-123 TaxID=2733863 RepID=UPI001BB36F47|nr:hypothetical protein [Catellatospora sp. TT07R-123]